MYYKQNLPLLLVSILTSILGFSTGRAIAQITPDQTLSTETSQVKTSTSGIPAQIIDGGATRGINLFHSFTEFNVNTNSQVYFQNPVGIENILSRVTGSNPSQILGTLGVLGNANLFLINPKGIIFGENATLDIRGSFLATTADGIKLGETGIFNAASPSNSNLLSIKPGVLFTDALRQYQGTITNYGNLTIGNNLILAADNLNLQGQLKAGGDLELIANKNLTIRDSQVQPFITKSGGNQLIQGNQLVDIFALNHPDSSLSADKNLVLRSGNSIQGDAHYFSGGNFQIQQLDQSPGDLISLVDPIILSAGDVKFNDSIVVSSLHILAGGSVTANNITITNVDTTTNTISPNNPNTFLASLSTFNLSDGTPIIIDGNKNQTLDIRAGIDWGLIPVFTGNINTNSLNITTNTNPSSAAINITKITNNSTLNNSITGNRSVILLTNQYKPNNLILENNINVTTILAGTNNPNPQNPGSLVIIDSRKDINIYDRINAPAFGTKIQNNGGNITLLADGKITLQPNSFIVSNGLKGGDIILRSKGDISLLSSSSISSNKSFQQGLLGGNITLDSQSKISIMNDKINDSIVSQTLSSSPDKIGGNITIKAKSFITNYAQITTSNQESATGGDIIIKATDNIELNNSSAISDTFKTTTGKAGNINIEAGSVFLNNKSTFDSRVSGNGTGGNITVTANDLVQFDGTSKALSTVETSGKGTGGNITIAVPNGTLIMKNQSQLESQTKGDGNAGDITIQARKFDLTNSQLSASTSGKGNAGKISIERVNDFSLNNSLVTTETAATGLAGKIDINSNTLKILNNARFSTTATNTATNNGGNINITANDIEINGEKSGLFAETKGQGAAGSLNINTSNLAIANGAKISATTTNTATKNGGNISITASDIQLTGNNTGLFAETQGQGAAGSLNVNTSNLAIANGAKISATATNTATNKAGDINITANDIKINGDNSGLFAETQGEGAAGSLNINTSNLTISNNGKVSAANIDGEGGSINLTANTLQIDSGGTTTTTTLGKKNAGNITVNVLEKITLSDANSGIFANTGIGSSGNSGNINIDPQIFIIKDGAGIGVNSQGSGQGGNISLQAGTLTLDNHGFITAATASNQGGEINLQIQDLLWLRHGSNITATAGIAGGLGNGGNITINAPFIIGFASENSNITANAFAGNGGNIDITSNAIFGLQFRNQETPLSDITASSKFGLSGNVEIKTPDVDPTAGLISLPVNLVDAESLVGRNICAVENDSVAKGSSFVITGKGGLPANSDDLITNVPGIVEWANHPSQQKNTSVVILNKGNINQEKTSMSVRQIQQAQGWIITNDGKIILTATVPNITPQSSGLNYPNCRGK